MKVLFTALVAKIAAAFRRKSILYSKIKVYDWGCIMQAHSARHSESYMLPIQVASTPQSDQLLLDLRSRSFQQIQLFRLILANQDVLFGKK